MGRVPVEVQIQRSGRRQQAMHLLQTRAEKIKVAAQVALPAVVEAMPAVGLRLGLSREEGRIRINQIAARIGQPGHEFQVVGADNSARLN